MPVTERDEEIYALYADKGMSKRGIARQLGINVQAVIIHIRKVEKVALKELVGKVEEMKVRQTDQLVHVYREAIAGWERSCTDKVVRKQSDKESTIGDGGAEFKQDIEIQAQAGDPRFLVAAMQAVEGLQRLWGLDAPIQVQHNIPSHANPKLARARAEAAKVLDMDLLSPAEREIRKIGSGVTAAAAAAKSSKSKSQTQEAQDAAAGPD